MRDIRTKLDTTFTILEKMEPYSNENNVEYRKNKINVGTLKSENLLLSEDCESSIAHLESKVINIQRIVLVALLWLLIVEFL